MDIATLNLILNIATIAMGGTALGAFLRYRGKLKELENARHSGDRDDDRTDFEALNEELRRQRDEAFARIERLEKRDELREAEIQGLRIARDLDPFPQWLMDIEGRYTFVNRPFEERFLEPNRQTYREIIGKAHADFWPESFCRTLQTLDAIARRRPDGTARANTTLDVPGLGECEVTVHKFPCRIKGVIVAYAGYITVMDPVSERVGQPKEASA